MHYVGGSEGVWLGSKLAEDLVLFPSNIKITNVYDKSITK